MGRPTIGGALWQGTTPHIGKPWRKQPGRRAQNTPLDAYAEDIIMGQATNRGIGTVGERLAGERSAAKGRADTQISSSSLMSAQYQRSTFHLRFITCQRATRGGEE